MSDSANKLIIVGHGPSTALAPDDLIDSHKVCRLRRAPMKCGKRTDIVCSTKGEHKQKKREFWFINEGGPLAALCRETLAPFNPKVRKPSTGLSACIVAKHKGYDVYVIGFDYTLDPTKCEDHKRWAHDLWAEHACIQTLGVKSVFDLQEKDLESRKSLGANTTNRRKRRTRTAQN